MHFSSIAAFFSSKEQLTLCQEDKSQLQMEMTATKSEMIRQATTIEKLKAENMRTKVNLNEVVMRSINIIYTIIIYYCYYTIFYC